METAITTTTTTTTSTKRTSSLCLAKYINLVPWMVFMENVERQDR